jgi:hypothetical protein
MINLFIDGSRAIVVSELIQQRSIQLRRIAHIRKAKVLQILPRHTPYIVRRHSAQPFHESVRRTEVALIQFGSRKNIRLIGVRLVL